MLKFFEIKLMCDTFKKICHNFLVFTRLLVLEAVATYTKNDLKL